MNWRSRNKDKNILPSGQGPKQIFFRLTLDDNALKNKRNP
ncbi:hypothetical protein OCAR_4128 [Afipia carboxidovorans OM5]|nr:hypothetical protein OCAR_4128 [Afipia carboxidovorans OM5]